MKTVHCNYVFNKEEREGLERKGDIVCNDSCCSCPYEGQKQHKIIGSFHRPKPQFEPNYSGEWG